MNQNKVMVGLLLMAVGSMAYAGSPIEEARPHLQAIAGGNLEQLVGQYRPDAQLQWVGGPLDGTYTGPTQIHAVWSRFIQANGTSQVTVGQAAVAANPKGATITVNSQFVARQPLKVRHVLLYREGGIANEIWQVDPTRQTAY